MKRTIRAILLNNLLPFFVILLSHSVCAQHFEWAASSSEVDLTYRFSSVDPDNNIVVGGLASRYETHHDSAESYDGKGKIISTDPYLDHQNVILNYSPSGAVNWQLVMDAWYTKLYGITHDNHSIRTRVQGSL